MLILHHGARDEKAERMTWRVSRAEVRSVSDAMQRLFIIRGDISLDRIS